MSVYILGMEMPTSCYGCIFFKQVDYWNKNDETDILSKCKRTGEFTWESVNGYMPNCPLIPVPEHGRLIEEKAIKNKIANHILDTEYAWGWNAAMKQCYEAVEDAPTIIPADPAKEGEG